MDLIFALLSLLAGALLLFHLRRRPRNFPPGPVVWPLVGTLPAMRPGKTPFDMMRRLRQQHGDLVGLFLGPKPAILVSGFENVKKISSMEQFNFRPPITLTQHHPDFQDQKLGLIFSEGERWKVQRRFTLRHLRDFGFGRKSMEQLIKEEVLTLFSELDLMSESGEGGDVLALLPVVTINALWHIIAGAKHDLRDQRFRRLTRAVLKFFRATQVNSPVGVFKILQKIPLVNRSFREQQQCGIDLCDFVQGEVKEHLRTYEEGHLRDFIDVFIREMRENPTDTFSENQLVAACVDLFLAGTETSSSTLGFTLRYLLWYPEVQEKVRQEIYKVVGKDRLPSMDDMPNLPFCTAVLTESLRHSGVTPITPPRSNQEDTTFNGYHIPKRTLVLVSLRSVHMDPEHWGDPENFRPERFISPEGKFLKDEQLLLFGTGSRMCLGEPFARNSAFLFFASIVQNYSLHSIEGAAPADVTMDGITTAPQHFQINVKKL